MMLLDVTVWTTLLFVVLVLASLAYNPRLWVQDFPEGIQAEMEPLSPREQIERGLFAVVLLGVVIGIPVLSVLRVKSARGDVTSVEASLRIWVVFMAVNLVDLVCIDWVIGVWWQPAVLSTPEFESGRQYNTYRFHLTEHAEGTVKLTVLALLLGVLVSV